MKATELMIGDWVCIQNGQNKQQLQITAIEDETICLNMSKEFPTMLFAIDRISPIPLTAETLEKNGFALDKASGIYRLPVHVDENYGYHLSLTAAADLIGYCLLVNEFVVFRYVHELQHALRLCGIEKEIVL